MQTSTACQLPMEDDLTYQIIYDFPESEYHALASVGSSTVKSMAISPAYYRQQQIAMEAKDKTAFAVGSMFHAAILEPEKENLFIAKPEGLDRRTREGKAAWAEFEELSEGRTILSTKDYENCIAMIDSFRQTNAYKKMFAGDIKTEVSIFNNERKCRFDLLKKSPKGFYVAYDLKTAAELPQNEIEWQRFFIKWGYHIQHAWYCEVARRAGIEVKAFHFAVVCKKPPYDYAVVTLDNDFIELGEIKAEQAYQLYLRCNKEDRWPGQFELSGVGSQKISMPRWAVQ